MTEKKVKRKKYKPRFISVSPVRSLKRERELLMIIPDNKNFCVVSGWFSVVHEGSRRVQADTSINWNV